MKWYFMAFKNYFNFSGRSRRKEYWMFTLFNMIIYMIFISLAMKFNKSLEYTSIRNTIFYIAFFYYLITIIPTLSLCARRFHDQNRSGWLTLLILIPSLGAIIIFVFMCINGTKGDNRFGLDPKTINT